MEIEHAQIADENYSEFIKVPTLNHVQDYLQRWVLILVLLKLLVLCQWKKLSMVFYRTGDR
jgi:hypothetical protein